MQIHITSMSVMLAMTKHGLCVRNHTMFGKFQNGRDGGGTYL